MDTGSVRRAKPALLLDGAESPVRLGRYGETISSSLFPGKQALADEGSCFVATNPTPGTALAFAVNATYDATKSLIAIRNLDSVGSRRVYLDYIKLIPTVAPASATSAHFALWLDSGNKYTSGGTAITPVNVNADDTAQSVSSVILASGGATLVTTAAARLVARGVLRSVIPAVHDELVIAAGADAGAATSSATAAGRNVSVVPSVVIPPQGCLLVNVWFPSNAVTGLSYEAEVSLFER